MKGQFEYFGLKTEDRRKLTQPFLQKEFLPSLDEVPFLIRKLWGKPQRDFQMFGLDLMGKYKKKLRLKDLEWIEFAIATKSWWDTVDFVASHLVGAYMVKFPDRRNETINKWMSGGNMWQQRSCVIFQLKYKNAVDKELLATLINQLLGSKEFYINKAIGWSLRECSKVNADWVVDFANKTELSNLSRREALRLIKS